jgi:bisphosphoglycerate-dependent phosphoglycerate mutase
LILLRQGLTFSLNFRRFLALFSEPQLSGQGCSQIEVEQQTIKDHQTAGYLSLHSFLSSSSSIQILSPPSPQKPEISTNKNKIRFTEKHCKETTSLGQCYREKKQHFHFPLMMLMGFSCETRLRDVKNEEEKSVQGFLIDVIFAAIKQF